MNQRDPRPIPLVIVGAGGFGRETLDAVEAMNRVERVWDFLGFLDDGKTDDALVAARGARILGPSSHLSDIECQYLIAIADPTVRERVDGVATTFGRQAATVIHPAALIGSQCEIAAGFIALAGASITTNVRIGRHGQINPTAAVGHDARLSDYCTLYPGARVSGNVALESGVTIASGACVLQGLTIGRGTFVGAGAVVTKSQPPGLVLVGVPARPLVR